MKGLDTYRVTLKMRLKEIAEAKKINEALLKHYNFILDYFDAIIIKYDDAIIEIEEKKEAMLKQFMEAPELLKDLGKHIEELAKSKKSVCDNDKKVKKVRFLREKLDMLEQTCRQEGINIEECLKSIRELEKMDAVDAMAEKIAEGERQAAQEKAEAEARGEV